ncbi:MAG: AMP-binding protein [Parvularculaceae bacterium]|nr:AMP-binding protein [Parvularculaceae bacterium]
MSDSPYAKNWQALYPSHFPKEPALEHDDMLATFRRTVDCASSEPAFFFFDRIITYGEVNEQSDALAAWLSGLGVSRGDRIAVASQNAPEFPFVILAAWKIGAIPVPINPLYKAQELSRILLDAEPSAIICEFSAVEQMRQALDLAGMASLPLAHFPSDFDGQQINNGEPGSLSQVLEQYHDQSPSPLDLSGDDIALILYTSGTTGAPKGAMLNHRALVTNSQFMRDWCDLSRDSRIYAVAPFFHITGFVCHMTTAFLVGCCSVIHYRFDPGLAVEMIRKWRPDFTIGAITAFNALISVPGVSPEDMKSFRQVYSGGAPVPPALKAQIEAALGITILPAYGMTETAAPAVFAPPHRQTPVLDGQLSIGIPIPSIDLMIADDDGAEVSRGEIGEVLMRGPQVMDGYWRKAEESAEALRGGWLHSGDIGKMDDDGWVYLIDRKKDVIISSGFKVWPTEVEEVLYQHAAIREAAVVGVPDDYRGENVKAFVTLKSGSEVTADELMSHCRTLLTGYKVPRFIEIAADLPKTVSGKIQRVALRNLQ